MSKSGVPEVWLVSAGVDEPLLRRLTALLSPDERERAASFRFDSDRHMSIVARAALRVLLGRWLGRAPESLRFTKGTEGKPALEGIEFNVSHSSGRVAIAISHEEVGVDVEGPREVRDRLGIAERFFAPSEAAIVRATPERFLDYWTAKEAVIKAVGGGLSIDLTSFEVDPVAGAWTPIRNRSGDARLDGWNVFALPRDGRGLWMALASRGTATPALQELDLTTW